MENLSEVKQPLGQQNIADWIDSWVAQGSFNDYVGKICSIFDHLWPLNIVKIEFHVPPTLTKDFQPHKLKIRQTLLKFPTYFKFKSEKFSKVFFYFAQSNDICLSIHVVTITIFVMYFGSFSHKG